MHELVEPKKVDIVYEKENPVLYDVVDHVAWITMDRPDFNNAQNGQMTYALDDAFNRAVQDDDVRVIVLSGAGRAFCAGYDLDWGTKGEAASQRAAGGAWDPVRDYLGMSRNVRAFVPGSTA